MQIHRSQKAEE